MEAINETDKGLKVNAIISYMMSYDRIYRIVLFFGWFVSSIMLQSRDTRHLHSSQLPAPVSWDSISEWEGGEMFRENVLSTLVFFYLFRILTPQH